MLGNRRSAGLLRDTVLVIFDCTRRNVGAAACEERDGGRGGQHVGWRMQLDIVCLGGVQWGGIHVQA